jgi:hypothetical protein
VIDAEAAEQTARELARSPVRVLEGSPPFKSASNVVVIAAIPLANASASSAPSRPAIRRSSSRTVGLP